MDSTQAREIAAELRQMSKEVEEMRAILDAVRDAIRRRIDILDAAIGVWRKVDASHGTISWVRSVGSEEVGPT